MRIALCGVRGSTPAPGPEFVRFGGNTSCVAVGRDDDGWQVILDGGTGLGRFSKLLDGSAFRGTLLLGHLHWDHTHGIPFFAAAEHPDSHVSVVLPNQARDAAAVLGEVINPPHFPLMPHELRGRWSFDSIEAGEHDIEGFSVLAREIPHPGGRTFGYRVSAGPHSIAYLSDHMPLAMGEGPDGLGDYHEAALELADGVDLLIHDAQHVAAEFPAKAFLGHSAAEYAVGLAQNAGARSVLFFHHDPDRTDDQVDAIAASCQRPGLVVEAAAEGRIIDLRRSSAT